jgi:hypothetical protein
MASAREQFPPIFSVKPIMRVWSFMLLGAALPGLVQAQGSRVVSISNSPAVQINAGYSRRWAFHVTSAQPSCRLTGRVLGIAGGQKDVDVLVMTQDGYINWQNNHQADFIFESGQKTAVTLDVPVEGEGDYVFVVSNGFSALSPKTAQMQRVKLTCAQPSAVAEYDTGMVATATVATATVATATVPGNGASANLPDYTITVADTPAQDIAAAQWLFWTWEEISPRTMCHLSGRILGLAGGQKDVEVMVMTEDDYLNWSNRHPAKVEFQSGRKTAITLDTPVYGAGKHILVVSNAFSALSAKTVQMQHVAVTCSEWPRN